MHLVCRNLLVKFVSKVRDFPVQCCTKQTKLAAVFFSSWRVLRSASSALPVCLQIARALPITPKGTLFQKTIRISNKTIKQISIDFCFRLDLESRISGFRPVLICNDLFNFYLKASFQSLVSCLSWSAFLLRC